MCADRAGVDCRDVQAFAQSFATGVGLGPVTASLVGTTVTVTCAWSPFFQPVSGEANLAVASGDARACPGVRQRHTGNGKSLTAAKAQATADSLSASSSFTVQWASLCQNSGGKSVSHLPKIIGVLGIWKLSLV